MDVEELRNILIGLKYNPEPGLVDDLSTVAALFDRFPRNTELVTSWWKVAVLDSLYATQLRFSGGTEDVARWITGHSEELDSLLGRGSFLAERRLETALLDSRTGGGTRIYSFASKFCHFSNPGAYPIWDRRSHNSVRAIHAISPFGRSLSSLDADDWYEAWAEDVKEVMHLLGVGTYREADVPLYRWNGGKTGW